MERADNEVTATGSAATDDSVPGEARPELSVQELKAEIEDTRAEMQQTIAEIQERLSPSHLAEQAKSTVREATIGRVSTMAERAGQSASELATRTRRVAERLPRPVRNNPLPFVLIGAGVVWALAGARSQGSTDRDEWNRDDDTADPSYGSRFDADHDYRSSRSSSMSDVTERLGEMASQVGQRARDIGRDTQSRISRTLDDNPLVLGAAALAAGAIIGMVLPRTEVEDSYLGETRDSMVESAREMAEDKVQQLSDAIRDESGAGTASRS